MNELRSNKQVFLVASWYLRWEMEDCRDEPSAVTAWGGQKPYTSITVKHFAVSSIVLCACKTALGLGRGREEAVCPHTQQPSSHRSVGVIWLLATDCSYCLSLQIWRKAVTAVFNFVTVGCLLRQLLLWNIPIKTQVGEFFFILSFKFLCSSEQVSCWLFFPPPGAWWILISQCFRAEREHQIISLASSFLREKK